jgi:murein DD-endopeptidase MepM/ murein hydrolase activator NlpD
VHRLARLIAALSLVVSLPVAGSDAATPPQDTAVPKPPGLALRLPWKAGEKHVLGAWRYQDSDAFGDPVGGDHKCGAGSQDCYALDVVGTPAYPLTTSTSIVAMFPGKVVFAGCATGRTPRGFWSYGKVVYIETRIGSFVYGALYAHLSAIGTGVVTGALVGLNQQIGRAGSSITNTTSRTCSQTSSANIHLHFAVYRFDPAANPKQFDLRTTVPASQRVHKASWWTAAGGPYGGVAVVPEPLIGKQVYENFRWWNDGTTVSPPMTAVKLTASSGPVCPVISSTPTCKWLGSQAEVRDGQSVDFDLLVRAATPLKEVHLTAWYDPNGSDPPTAWDQPDSRFVGFTPGRIWRIVAVCRPPAANYTGSTYKDSSGCLWTSIRKNSAGKVVGARLRYRFDPRLGGAPPQGISWLPGAVPAWPTNGRCVAMKISFNIYDTAGGMKLAGDRVLPTSCPGAAGATRIAGAVQSVAAVPGAQVVYLRPLGHASWTRQYGTPGLDGYFAVAADSQSITTYGPTNGEMSITRHDRLGNQLWQTAVGPVTGTTDTSTCGHDDEIGNSMSRNSGGAALVFTTPGRTPPGYLAYFRNDGSLAWSTLVDDCNTSVAADDEGVTAAATHCIDSECQRTYVTVTRYDTSGVAIWSRQIGDGSSLDAWLTDLKADEEAIYLSGSVLGMTEGCQYKNMLYSFVRRLSRNGNTDWTYEIPAVSDCWTSSSDRIRLFPDPVSTGVIALADRSLPTRKVRLLYIGAAGSLDHEVPLALDPRAGVLSFAASSTAVALVGGNYYGGRPYGTDNGDGWVALFANGASDPEWLDIIDSGSTDYVTGMAADGMGFLVSGQTFGSIASANQGWVDAYLRSYDW